MKNTQNSKFQDGRSNNKSPVGLTTANVTGNIFSNPVKIQNVAPPSVLGDAAGRSGLKGQVRKNKQIGGQEIT
jgi:hypothetical protein